MAKTGSYKPDNTECGADCVLNRAAAPQDTRHAPSFFVSHENSLCRVSTADVSEPVQHQTDATGGQDGPVVSNLNPDQMSLLRGRRYNRAKRQGARTDLTSGQNDQKSETTAESLAKQHGVTEKTIRRDGKFADAVEKVKTLEKLERPKAAERRSSTLKQNRCGDSPQRAIKGATRDIVGRAVGMGGATYEGVLRCAFDSLPTTGDPRADTLRAWQLGFHEAAHAVAAHVLGGCRIIELNAADDPCCRIDPYDLAELRLEIFATICMAGLPAQARAMDAPDPADWWKSDGATLNATVQRIYRDGETDIESLRLYCERRGFDACDMTERAIAAATSFIDSERTWLTIRALAARLVDVGRMDGPEVTSYLNDLSGHRVLVLAFDNGETDDDRAD